MVERDLPKVDVAGSSPVIRSKACFGKPFLYYSIRVGTKSVRAANGKGNEENTMKYTYIPHGVCSRLIELEIEDDIIKSCRFIGGCNGNLKGISSLIKGMDVNEAIEKLRGIDCGGRGTSCPDQLSKALIAAQEA